MQNKKNSVPYKWIHLIAEKYNLNPTYLITGRGYPFNDIPTGLKKIRLSPIVSSADVKTLNSEEISIDIPQNLQLPLDIGEEYFYFKLADNSMIPTFYPGDILIVDKTKKIEVGDVFVFKWSGDIDSVFLVRRIGVGEIGLILISDNGTYPTLCLEYNRFELVGKVVGFF